MTEYAEHNLARLKQCPIDIYVASNMPYRYPYKLLKPEHATKPIANSTTTLIMDSGITDKTANQDVIDLAMDYDADFIVPCDELHDQQATTEAVKEFLDLYDDSDCRATPFIPLQPPYDEHYDELAGHYHYMLGGIAFDYSAGEQIEEMQRFRRAAGPEPYAHALGVGGSLTVARVLGNNPNLVQSVDCSTPEQAAINSSVIDATLKQQPIEILTGEGSSPGRYQLAKTNAYQLVDCYTKQTRQSEGLAQWT